MAGLDPATIEQMTGLTSCNISEGTTIQQVIGTDPPLQKYLANNRPPRILLTTWTPSYFKPDQEPLEDFHVEGMWYAWRYGQWKTLLSRQFGDWTLTYIAWEIEALWDGATQHLRGNKSADHDARLLREERKGRMGWDSPPETHCVRTYNSAGIQRWQNSVESFRRKYTTPETRVIIDISPIPQCDPLYQIYAHASADLSDNKLERLPIEDFNNGDVHLGPAGAKAFSTQVAAQVLTVLRK